jgi:primosomal protein N' (replication factor Y)
MIVDGDKELQRPGLRTTENCLRWWGHAASLTANEAPVILANVEGSFASQFSTNQWESIVETELRERRALGFPPATRAIAVRGAVNDLQDVRNLEDVRRHRVIGPAPDGETFRIVILADYRSAPEAISAIRAHLIATSSNSLRVHCDDLSIFDEVDND